MSPEEKAERKRLAKALETTARLLAAFQTYVEMPIRAEQPLRLRTIQRKQGEWRTRAA